eukprot:Partr_v1_DN25424_c0_g1_i1_m53510 putative WD repeatcontaining protein
MQTGSLPLTDDTLRSMRMVKTFKSVPAASGTATKTRILDMDFDDSGDYSVCSLSDESIKVFDCLQGKEKKLLLSKKYGIHYLRFAHTSTSIIHSSTKEDDTIRYLSLHDNRYLRYFKGHKARVTGLDVSPVDDTVISAGMDDTVRLWDLRSSACQGVTHIRGRPSVAFDPQGLIFALGIAGESIRFYDLRSYEQGPFGIVPTAGQSSFFGGGQTERWASMKFSNNGTDMLVSNTKGMIYVIDSVEYRLKFIINGIPNTDNAPLAASFSPDGRYILSGTGAGTVGAWRASDGTPVAELQGPRSVVTHAEFNPRRLMMITAGVEVGMWIPSFD